MIIHIYSHVGTTEYCQKYAMKENDIKCSAEDESEEDDEISDNESGSSDDDVAGHADP